ncbi:MAG: hypothetical protein KGI08_11160 [Thaumarchaeota archaeon]|nr:hypothetical protein [Nitrososphaerota archaeon]
MVNQTISELVKMADKIVIDQVKGKKVTLKISWFDLKGARKSKKFLLEEKEKIEF